MPSDPSALFVSKSVATRAVLAEGTAFTQTIVLKNGGAKPWVGYVLARPKTYGSAGKATDALGAAVDSVAVPLTKPGKEATIALSLKAVKSDSKSGAAQAAPWELRTAAGTKVPIMVDATTQAKGGCVWTVITINPPQGSNVPNLSHAAYVDKAANTYVKIGYGGQCTAYVYARIKEKLGVALEGAAGSAFGCNGAGQKWIDQLTGPGKPYRLEQTPKANAIAVWSLKTDPNAGHVAFVEAIDAAGKLLYTEANAVSWKSFASDNGPDSDCWGGGYDGAVKTATHEQMLAHFGAGYAFRGYIAIA